MTKTMYRGLAALALAGAVLAAPSQSVAETPAEAGRADDRMAIENTLQDYVRGLDGADMDAYLATLTDDASFLSKEGNYFGKLAIADYVRPVFESRKRQMADGSGTVSGTHHIVTNQALRFIDSDNAVMRSYWMFATARKGGGIELSLMGSSEDYLVRQGGKWLIRERRVETL